MTLSMYQYGKLIRHLTRTARETFNNTAAGELPQTYEDFEQAMWTDDREMTEWKAMRDEYRAAMRNAYNQWRAK